MATPVIEVNSAASEGCPIKSRDGLRLYIASMRPGGILGNDIWAADRASKDAFGSFDVYVSRRSITRRRWSDPTKPGPNVNTDWSVVL